MPILATGNKPLRDREAGFSLVELLAVLAILSLMVGAVVMNLPDARSETDRISESLQAQMNRFLDDGALAGEMRGLGPSEDGVTLFRHDGLGWIESADLPWPNGARVTLTLDGVRTELPETATPILLFEPYGTVPDFTLTLQDRDADYMLSANARGGITRVVER